MQRLCHICTAVVHHDGFACTDLGHAKILCGAHFLQIILQELAGELQVDKAGHHCLNHTVIVGIQLGDHGVGDLDGCAFVLLGGSQSAVALIFAQVGTVGNGDPAKGCIITGLFKGGLHLLGDNV